MRTATLHRQLRDISAGVFDRELLLEWFDEDYAAALARATKEIDLNDHRDEIIRTYVRRDVSDRAKIPLFGAADKPWQLEMFTEEIARQAVFRVGTGARTKVYDATGSHWQSHLFQQQKALQATAASITRVVTFLESPPGNLLMNAPALRTHDVMRQLGLWSQTP